MTYLLFFLLIPVVIIGGAKLFFHSTITTKEFLVVLGINVVIISGLFFGARWGSMRDFEIWNGKIAAKVHGTEGCCHCRTVCTGSGKDETCTTECDHFTDYYWSLKLTTGDEIVIENCEPNPKRVPKAWENAHKGEPASAEHSYTNYLLADKDSILRREGVPEELQSKIHKYPRVHHHYKMDHWLNWGVAGLNDKLWETELDRLNADYGARLQVNVVVIVTPVKDEEFARAVEAKWLRGKKNDLIFIFSTGDEKETKVLWADVVSINNVSKIRNSIRNGFRGRDLADWETQVQELRKVATEFRRKPMEEFSYLASAAEPSTTWMVIILVLDLILSIGGVVLAHHKDFFGENFSRTGYYRWRR